jgi:hypothetical protein
MAQNLFKIARLNTSRTEKITTKLQVPAPKSIHLRFLLEANIHRYCGNISQDQRKMVLNLLPLFSFALIN